MASRDGTRIEDLRIQVRLSSGKIYGPYTRDEVLSFIDARKLKGGEEILLEGQSNWKAITSDVGFFDAFQAILAGKKPLAKSSRFRKKDSVPTKIAQVPLDDLHQIPATMHDVPGTLAAPIQESLEASESPSPTIEPIPPSAIDELPGMPPKNTSAKKSQRRLLIVVVASFVAGLILFFGAGARRNINRGQDFSGASAFTSAGRLVYGKNLAFLLQDFALKVPSMPPKLEGALGASLNLRQGLGAELWVRDLQNLMTESSPDVRRSVSYWARWSWNLQWLGETIGAFDLATGEDLRRLGRGIFDELVQRKQLTKSQEGVFRALTYVFSAQWKLAENELKKITEVEDAQWLAELCSWMSFWTSGAKGQIFQSSAYSSYSSSQFDLIAQLRRAFSSQDPRFFQKVQQLGDTAPSNFELWLNASEYLWRFRSDNLDAAQKLFVSGLATLSLVPPAFQQVYWGQFAEFLNAYGQAQLSARAQSNLELLAKNDLGVNRERQKLWWDLGSTGLDVDAIAGESFERVQKALFLPLDMPTLSVLGPISKQGGVYLSEAAYHFAFQGEWRQATELFEKALRLDKKNIYLLGGLIWSYSSLYQFDKALKTFDILKVLPSDSAEGLKFQAVIEMQGREYDSAKEKLGQYLKQNPNNGWGHYFNALLSLKVEKSLDCAKSANLARVHSSGELKTRSVLLFYRCRILSRLGVRDTLRELEATVKKDPINIPLIVEWIDAQLSADLPDAALKTAQDALAAFPRSYELRLKLAEVYERRGNPDMALAFYNDAKKDRPDSAEASVRVAKLFEKQEKYFEAAQNYETAARVDSNYPDVWIFAARAYEKIGRYNDAAQMYIREVDARPAVLQTFIEAAEFMLKINAPQEVPKIFRKFNEDFQGDPRVLTRLAQAYLAMGEVDNARQSASLALSTNPKIPEANRVLAVIYDQLGQVESAKQYYENYLRLLPQAVDADQVRAKLSQPPYANF